MPAGDARRRQGKKKKKLGKEDRNDDAVLGRVRRLFSSLAC